MSLDPLAKLEAAGPELNQVVATLEQLGQREQARRLAALYQSLRGRAVRVVTVGAFNQGKSTLINALIGAKVLPVALVPTTAVMTRVVSAMPPGATLYYAEAKASREVSLDEVSEHLELDPAGKPRPLLRLVEVRCPWRNPADAELELYDTPGFNDLPEQAEAAREAIENADLLLFMLNARQPLTEQEESIWQGWAARTGARPIFLLNFLNLLEDDDQEPVFERVRLGLQERLNLKDAPELLEINALLALRARLKNNNQALIKSRLPELAARLDYYNGPRRIELLKATRVGRLQTVLGEIYSENRVRLEEAEAKLRGWRERVTRQEAAHRQLERAVQLFSGIEESKKRNLTEFEFKLLAELENAVERWPLPQLRSQIEGLTGQRMRDWLAYFEGESNQRLGSLKTSVPLKPLKFVTPASPPYQYNYAPPSAPPPGPNLNPFEAPFDFLGNAVRGLGQFVDELAGQQRGPDSQLEQRERVIAHSRLAALVHEATARLETQVSAVLAVSRATYIPKIAPPEPPPPGLENEVKLRQTLDSLIAKKITILLTK